MAEKRLYGSFKCYLKIHWCFDRSNGCMTWHIAIAPHHFSASQQRTAFDTSLCAHLTEVPSGHCAGHPAHTACGCIHFDMDTLLLHQDNYRPQRMCVLQVPPLLCRPTICPSTRAPTSWASTTTTRQAPAPLLWSSCLPPSPPAGSALLFVAICPFQ